MDDSISVSVTGDVSGLEQALERATQLVGRAGEAVAEAWTQTQEKRIAGEEQANAFLLATGGETVEAFEAQAEQLENARYKAAQEGLKKRSAAEGQGNAEDEKYEAEAQALAQEHADRLLSIAEESARKKQQIDETEFSTFVREQDQRLATGLDAIAREYKDHEIGAQEKRDLEVALTQSVEAEVLKRFDAEHAALVKGTEAWAEAVRERQTLAEGFAHRVQQADNQLTDDETAAWRQGTTEIFSAEDGFVRDLFTRRQKLSRDLAQLAGKMAEDEIAADLKMWTERALLAVLGNEEIRTTEQGGVLMHSMMEMLKTTSTTTQTAVRTSVSETAEAKDNAFFLVRLARWVASELGMTTATTAGTATRETEQATSAATGAAATAAANTMAAMNNMGVAVTGAAAAVANIPYAGPALATAAAAEMTGLLSPYVGMASLDVGAWEIPQDMPALLHKGEMVVPQNFASGLRGGNTFGGDSVTFNNHYAPNINVQNADWAGLLRNGGAEFADAIQRGYRTGLPMRPSMRNW